MNKKIHRIAVIGAGSSTFPHIEALTKLNERVEIKCVYTRSKERASEFNKHFPIRVIHNLDTIEKNPDIDCVLIATPPFTHFEMCEKFAIAGKHILLEKPIEISSAKSNELVKMCEKYRVNLSVVFQHRFRASSITLKQYLESGQLGKILCANASVPWWRPQSYYDSDNRGSLSRDGGGVLITQAIHVIDLLIALTGGVSEVMAFAETSSIHRMEAEDLVAAVIKLKSGGIGTLFASTTNYPGYVEWIEIVGENGTARLSGHYLEIKPKDGNEIKEGEEHTSTKTSLGFLNHEAYRKLLCEYFDAIDEGRKSLNSGRESLNVHYLIDAILHSSRIRKPVLLKSPG